MPSSPKNDTQEVGLYVAIFKPQSGVFRHWGLFVDDETKPIYLNVQGSSNRFRFEELKEDVRKSETLLDLVKVTQIPKPQIDRLRRRARKQPINKYDAWNCQTYVMELLDTGVDDGLIEVDEKKKDELMHMLEG